MKDCCIKVNPDNISKILFMLEKAFPVVKWCEGEKPTEYIPKFSKHNQHRYLIIFGNKINVDDDTLRLKEFCFRTEKLKRLLR